MESMNVCGRFFVGRKRRAAGGILKSLLVMYLITGLLLLLLATLMFKLDFSVQIARIAIIAIYVVSGFIGGILMGKHMKTRKFIWGMLIGLSYFAILLLASLIVNGGIVEDMTQLLITLVLCAASSMIGGMVS